MIIEHNWCKNLKCPKFADGSCLNEEFKQQYVCSQYVKLMQTKTSSSAESPDSGYDGETLSKLHDLGIVKCTSKLKDTNFAPLACMKTLKRKLYFMGVSGAKWVENTDNAAAFRRMLNKVETNNGAVKFLLIHPGCDDYIKMKKQREGAMGNKAYCVWRQLLDEYACLEVRCYTHLPSFRLQFMDDNLLAISRYQFLRELYDKYNQGWDSPHLIIDSSSECSFYTVFERYFIEEWNDAIDLKQITILD